MSKKRVLIGLPAFNGAGPAALEGFMCLTYHLGRRETDYDFFLRVVGAKEQFRARNVLVNMAIGYDMDYLFMLDGDQVVPNDTFSRLAAHGKDIIGGLYLQKLPPYRAVILRENKMEPGKYDFVFDYPQGLTEVDVIGGGCMLLSVSMLKKMKEPYFVPEIEKGTDIQICEKARALGYKVYMDTTVEIGHVCEPQVLFPHDVPMEERGPNQGVNTEDMAVLDRISGELCSDYREFTNMTTAEYSRTLNVALAQNADIWYDKPRNDESSVLSFYKESELYNTIRQTYYTRHSAWSSSLMASSFMRPEWLKGLGVKSVLDYGCGISILSKHYIEEGFDYTCADIHDTLQLKFLQWRKEKYQLPLTIVGVNETVKLPKSYDLVLMLDVIEHLWDPWKVLDVVLGQYLNNPGYFVTNAHIMNFDKSPANPQHICRINQSEIVFGLRERYGLEQDYNRHYLFARR